MRKISFFVSVILFFGIALCSAQDESITITTYYPSPYGVYNALRLYPHSTPPITCDDTQKGTMYYDSDDDQIRVCRGTFGAFEGWQLLGGWWTSDNGEDIYNTNRGKVGIGTTAPNAALQVIGAISRQESTLKGTPQQRATQVNLGINSTTRDDYSSVGGGRWNTASGWASSVAGGAWNTASGWASSVAGGAWNTASGGDSFVAGGDLNTASGWASSVAGGGSNTASGHYSFVAGGLNNTASGYASFVAGGRWNIASGQYCWAGGWRARAIHSGSFVWADNHDSDYSSNGDNTFNIRASGGIYHAGGQIHDIAEFMDVLKKEEVSEVEIVSLKEEQKLGKSSRPYDKYLLGVVSSKRTTTLHLGNTQSEDPDIARMPITLVGQVYVKVTNEGGKIKFGDPITSSSLPGIGMKANRSGKIIGYAMQDCDFQDKDIEEILVFVNVGYYIKESELTNLLEEIQLLKQEIKKLKQLIS